MVGGGLAGKAVAAGATKLMLGKLAAPFGAKAVAAAGTSAGGAVAGAAAGPAGAVAGAVIGLSVDYLINSGVALVQRGEFEDGVSAALATTEAEWTRLLEEEAGRVVNCWFDDATTALLQTAQLPPAPVVDQQPLSSSSSGSSSSSSSSSSGSSGSSGSSSGGAAAGSDSV